MPHRAGQLVEPRTEQVVQAGQRATRQVQHAELVDVLLGRTAAGQRLADAACLEHQPLGVARSSATNAKLALRARIAQRNARAGTPGSR